MQIAQPIYTDVIAHSIQTTAGSRTIQFQVATESGLGSLHEVTLIGRNSLPRILKVMTILISN